MKRCENRLRQYDSATGAVLKLSDQEAFSAFCTERIIDCSSEMVCSIVRDAAISSFREITIISKVGNAFLRYMTVVVSEQGAHRLQLHLFPGISRKTIHLIYKNGKMGGI